MVSVLVVDDSSFIARSMKCVLEAMDFNVVALAHDGVQGLEKYEELGPDVMLLDVTMPNMDGVECLTRVRELDEDARVVMLSAVHDEETINQCLALGAMAFLQKPIRNGNQEDMDRLRTTLETASLKQPSS